ncbi:hypothetical protein FOL47_002811 [Perkinsus chesapeaki]|uniref:Uncharacterized protein n=1 Tax=Perkinsus chesapeaki TaxID=330153 RepID=A0A7J6MBJ6_PERCH|nr:hypothetical protein FOL47_002811 [Perkinsus chesapeaki]
MPVRMVLPIVAAYTAAKWKLKIEAGSVRGTSDAFRLVVKHAFRAYVTFEIYFYFAYLWQRWQLNKINVHLVPKDPNITREKRMAKLKRSLRGLRQIHEAIEGPGDAA